jgi:hypothetical protein
LSTENGVVDYPFTAFKMSIIGAAKNLCAKGMAVWPQRILDLTLPE